MGLRHPRRDGHAEREGTSAGQDGSSGEGRIDRLVHHNYLSVVISCMNPAHHKSSRG
jgi:hypothetical protein